jgi:hypothetical protein
MADSGTVPTYAPELIAAESLWANVKNGLGDLAADSDDHLTAIVCNRLEHPVPMSSGPNGRTPTAASTPVTIIRRAWVGDGGVQANPRAHIG